MKLTEAQRRFLSLLADDPSIFAWKSKKDGRLVEAYGPPENWSHFQIIKRVKDDFGRVVGRRAATITAQEHFAMSDAGLTDACTITPAGRAALEASNG